MIDIVPRPARFSSRLRYDRQQYRAEDAGQDHVAGTMSTRIRDGRGSVSPMLPYATIAAFRMTSDRCRKRASDPAAPAALINLYLVRRPWCQALVPIRHWLRGRIR